mmetsp:Transcript_24618/g.30717  ORF Transcript_24618/g.30717 Transcript_24618/m.30717 type:complete len:301 (-) Transcript_24618:54-956(-)
MCNGEYPQVIVDCHNKLGEGVTWDPESETVYWIDIEGKELHQYDPENGAHKMWALPSRPGSFAIACDGRFLFGFEEGFALYDLETRSIERIEGPYVQEGNLRLNDGKCDRQGRFICGGYNEDSEQACGVYQVDLDLSIKELFDFKVRCANSTCFSPDGRTMYFTDSPSKQILAFDYNVDTGEASNKRVFVNIVSDDAVADGSTVDSLGYLWNAEWNSGLIRRYTPDGTLDRTVRIPTAKRLTCLSFGGKDLDTLYITSASIDLTETELKEQPDAGALFALKVDVTGIPEPRFGEMEEVIM